MKNLDYKSNIQTGVYTKVINMESDLTKRIIISRNFEKNNAVLDFFVSDIANSDAFDVLHYLKKGEKLEIAKESSNNSVAIYTYDVVKLGYIPSNIASLFSNRIESGRKDNIHLRIKKINSLSTKGAIEVRSIIDLG